MSEGERLAAGNTRPSSAGASSGEDDDSVHAALDMAPIDVDEIARLVYQLMLKDLAIGRERGE